MSYLLFCIYLLLFTWLMGKLSWLRNLGIKSWHLQLYFGIKVTAGVIYGYAYPNTLRSGGDTWTYHNDGLQEYQVLRSDPVHFVTSLFQSGYQHGYGSFFSTKNSFWNDLDANAIPKMLAIFNLFTGCNYYVNVLFYNALILLGPLLIYKVWSSVLPATQKLWLYLPFLIPSFLFWTSGIHKEGLLTLALGLVVYAVYFGFKQQTFTAKRWLLIVTGLLIILILRNILLLTLTGALTGWVLAQKLPFRAWATYLATLVLLAILFFGLRTIWPRLDFPGIVAERQAAFLQKQGGSKIAVTPLEPTISSFAVNAPEAFINATFRPSILDIHHPASAAAALENLLLLVLTLTAVFISFKARWENRFLLFCLLFSLLVLLSIGYTIPFLGAAVRYRSIILPLMVMPSLYLLYSRKSGGCKL